MIPAAFLAGVLAGCTLAVSPGNPDARASAKYRAAPELLQWLPPPVVQRFSGTAAEWEVILRNTSWSTVELRDITSLQAGAGAIDNRWLAPGMSTLLHLQAPTEGLIGLHRFAFDVSSANPGGAQARIVVSAFVDSAYIPEQPVMDLGVQQRDRFSIGTLSLKSFETDRLELIAVPQKPEWLEISAIARREPDDPQQLELQAKLESAVTTGPLDAMIRLQTNLPMQPFIDVRILGSVFDDVVADPFPLRFGAVNVGKSPRRKIRLGSSPAGALEIREIRQSSDDLDITWRDCGKKCVELVAILDAGAIGLVSGQMTVSFASGQVDLEIPYEANVVSETTEIVDLGILHSDSDVTIEGRMGPKP